jgi:hypothetical protein
MPDIHEDPPAKQYADIVELILATDFLPLMISTATEARYVEATLNAIGLAGPGPASDGLRSLFQALPMPSQADLRQSVEFCVPSARVVWHPAGNWRVRLNNDRFDLIQSRGRKGKQWFNVAMRNLAPFADFDKLGDYSQSPELPGLGQLSPYGSRHPLQGNNFFQPIGRLYL